MIIKGRWAWALIIALILSLGANFFVAGFLANRAAFFRGFRGPPPLANLLADFPPEMRREIGRKLWRESGEFRAAADAIGTKRRDIAEAFRAPEIDEARLRSHMRDIRDLTLRLLERAQDSLIEIVSRMPPEERARIGRDEHHQRR